MRAYILPVILTALASNADVNTPVTIVDHITTGNDNIINQPEQLTRRLFPVIGVEETELKEEIHHPPSPPVFLNIRLMSCTHHPTGV